MSVSQSSSQPRKFLIDLNKELNFHTHPQNELQDSERKSEQSSYDHHSSLRADLYHTKNSSTIEDFLKTVNKTEKKITFMEKFIRKTPKVRTNLDNPQILKDLQAQLIQQRQHNYGLQQENEKLKRKVKHTQTGKNDLISLQEDYQALLGSFKRSESIRKKQKGLISSLKSQISANFRLI